MFFLMSGFLMMCGYADKSNMKVTYDWIFAKSFMLNRIARLIQTLFLNFCLFIINLRVSCPSDHQLMYHHRMAPLVYFSILLMLPIAVMVVTYSEAATDLSTAILIAYILTVLFLQAWVPALNIVNGPLWSTCRCFLFSFLSLSLSSFLSLLYLFTSLSQPCSGTNVLLFSVSLYSKSIIYC